MTDQSTNPFVLPGIGQGSSDTAGNPLLASMEMMRQAWAGLTGPGGLAQALPMTPPMNLQDLERRIAELRTVESWLRMNLSMLSSTIQGMEVQRSTIATLRSFVDNLGTQAHDPSIWGGASPLEVVLGLKPAPGSTSARPSAAGESAPRGSGPRESGPRESGPPESEPHESAPRDEAPEMDTGAPPASRQSGAPSGAGPSAPDDNARRGPADAAAGSAQAISQAAQSASEAWWGMLQQQFNQLAAATAASMPGSTGGANPAAQGAAGAHAAPGQNVEQEAAASRHHGAGQESKTAARKSPAAKAGAPRNGAASTASDTPRKTGVKKNKIQSEPDQS
jgi:hypothetical protein